MYNKHFKQVQNYETAFDVQVNRFRQSGPNICVQKLLVYMSQ